MKRLTYASFLLVILLALNFAPNLSAQSQPGCKLLDTVYDVDGAKWIIQMCPADGTAPPTATQTPTKVPTIVAGPTPPPVATPLPPVTGAVWISRAEVQALQPSGEAFGAVLAAADSNAGAPNLSDQDSGVNVTVLAEALLYAHTGNEAYRLKVVNAIHHIVDVHSEDGGRTLSLGRELGAFVAAADLIGLRTYDPTLHDEFSARLRELLTKPLDGRTLVSTHEDRANNWGTHAGATRAAIAVYLGDTAELERTAYVFRGWLGDLTAYRGFKFGDLGWQSDPANPVGINPVGATKGGHSIDGALPEEMRRGGAFKWPPAETGYAWGGLNGAVAQAEMLYRAGYPAYEWGDKAILRAVKFLYDDLGWQATGDDAWVVALVNQRYGTTYAVNGTAPGKGFAWTAWTAGSSLSLVVSASSVHERAFMPLIDRQEDLLGETRIVLANSLGDLNDEMAYLLLTGGWLPVGAPGEVADDEGNVLSQVMER